jgi:hypothetical protein
VLIGHHALVKHLAAHNDGMDRPFAHAISPFAEGFPYNKRPMRKRKRLSSIRFKTLNRHNRKIVHHMRRQQYIHKNTGHHFLKNPVLKKFP